MRIFLMLCLALCLLVGSAAAKENKEAQQKKEDKEVVLAEVGPYKLTKAEFEARLESAPPQIKMLLAHQPELKKALVDRWVEMSLLSLGAKDAGIDKDPKVKQQIEEATHQILAQAYLQKEILSKVEPPSEKELRKYYEEHKDRFVEPEAVRVRHILIEVPQGQQGRGGQGPGKGEEDPRDGAKR